MVSSVKGVYWSVEKGEMGERVEFRVLFLGTDDYNALFPIAFLADAITTLTAISNAAPDVLVRSVFFQGLRNSKDAHTPVVLSYRDGIGDEMRFNPIYLPDLIATLTLFQTALPGLETRDWDATTPTPPPTGGTSETGDEMNEYITIVQEGGKYTFPLSVHPGRRTWILARGTTQPIPSNIVGGAFPAYLGTSIGQAVLDFREDLRFS